MKITTHPRPHIEEIVAYLMLKLFGEKFFPGISQVSGLTFVNPREADGKEAEAKGEIMVGVGHGRFDEHPALGEPRKEGECAATLVAKHLGIMDNPAWSKLIKFVTINDLKGQGSPFDVGYLPKIMYPSESVETSVTVETVVDWISVAIRAIYASEKKSFETKMPFDPQAGISVFDRIFAAWIQGKCGEEIPNGKIVDFVFGSKQLSAEEAVNHFGMDEDPAMEMILRFFKAWPKADNLFDLKGIPALICALNPDDKDLAINWLLMALDAKYNEQIRFIQAGLEYEEKAELAEVAGFNGRPLKIAVIDDCDNPLMNKYARSEGIGLIIQRQEWGNTQIYINKKLRFLKIYDLAAMIRLAEQEAQGKVETKDWQKLREEGVVKGCENWYFHHEGQMLLNGSLTTEQPPTRLALREILRLAIVALNPEFPPGKAKYCSRGICTRPCSMYKWGLRKCVEARKQAGKPKN
ncbi:MAG: hypothetical protein NT026_00190 [Candidatus Staskawiczbacteria bacterium]|nr:hypothetical protein [Candidatus Staskawiczbacteria bacterium]